MKIILSTQKKRQFEKMRYSIRDGQVSDRIKAVSLAFEGWSQTMIFRSLRIHESIVAEMNKWLHHHGFSYKKSKGMPHKLNIEMQQSFMEHYNETHDTLNCKSIVRFFWKNTKDYYPLEQKIRLVLDSAAYNQRQIRKNSSILSFITYSKNINSINRLWKVINEYSRNNIYLSSKAEFTTAINDFKLEVWHDRNK